MHCPDMTYIGNSESGCFETGHVVFFGGVIMHEGNAMKEMLY